MKNTVTSLLILFAASSVVFAQTNVQVSSLGISNTEPYLAVNPTNSNNLIAAWMRLALGHTMTMAVSSSTNGGTTWSAPVMMPHLYPSFAHADPSLAFDKNGEAYLCFIDYDALGDSGYVMVAHSSDEGATWGTPVKAISALESSDVPIDRPWIAVDRSGGQYNGNIYVTSKSYYETPLPHHVWFTRLTDGGTTWSTHVMIDDSIQSDLVAQSMGALTVGVDGSVYIGYISWDPSLYIGARAVLMKSTNGGTSFTPSIVENLPANSGVADTLYQGSYCLSANPKDPNNLIFIATDAQYGDPDIVALHSTDGGTSWSSIVRVNDDPKHNGVGQDMCWGSFSNDGSYTAAWRDRRNTGGADTDAFEVYAAVSTDGGATFSRNVDLSSTPSPFIDIVRGNDFLGIAIDSNNVSSAWSDKRTGNTQIFYGAIPVSSIVSSVDEAVHSTMPSESLLAEAFPNPDANGEITLRVNDTSTEVLHITLTDVAGKEVLVKDVPHYAGIQDIPLNISSTPLGEYVVTIAGGKDKAVQLVVKMK